MTWMGWASEEAATRARIFELPAEPPTPVENDMCGWVRTSSRGKWHQAIWVLGSGTPGTYVIACMGSLARGTTERGEPYDYRWRPPLAEWCRHVRCRREVGP